MTAALHVWRDGYCDLPSSHTARLAHHSGFKVIQGHWF